MKGNKKNNRARKGAKKGKKRSKKGKKRRKKSKTSRIKGNKKKEGNVKNKRARKGATKGKKRSKKSKKGANRARQGARRARKAAAGCSESETEHMRPMHMRWKGASESTSNLRAATVPKREFRESRARYLPDGISDWREGVGSEEIEDHAPGCDFDATRTRSGLNGDEQERGDSCQPRAGLLLQGKLACVCVCWRVGACNRAPASVHVVRASSRACVRACICACVRSCVRAC
eukprot:5034187-Pleurochrysis_carterae.AAC.1